MLDFNNLSIVLFLLPVYQMMYYAVQLITLRKNVNPSRRPLGGLMFLMWLSLAIGATGYLGYMHVYRKLYFLQLPVLLAIIPTYYLYLRGLSNSFKGLFSKPWPLYYLPSVLILLLNIVACTLMSQGQFDFFLNSKMSLSNINDMVIHFAMMVSVLGYLVLIPMQLVTTPIQYFIQVRRLTAARKRDPEFLLHFQPVWSIILSLSVILFVALGSTINYLALPYNHALTAFLNIGILISGGLAGYFGIRQNQLYIQFAGIEMEDLSNDYPISVNGNALIEAGKKHNGVVNAEEANIIISNLQHHLTQYKPYLNCTLEVVDLARKIGTTKQKLTYVVNEELGTNFYGIINKYRVLEAKELLKRPENQNYTIDAISKMVGFQSKSSFNAWFKKFTEMTPSEFRKDQGI